MVAPMVASAAISMASSYFGGKSANKAAAKAAAEANRIAAEQRKLAEARETSANVNNVNSINQQKTSDLGAVNRATNEALGNAVASTAGSGLGGSSISELSTQVMIDSARERADLIRQADQGISAANTQLIDANQNRAFEAANPVRASKVNLGSQMLNAGLTSLGQGLVSKYLPKGE